MAATTKSRFTTPDVRAMVRDLRGTLIMGKRLANVYDLSEKSYLFKFSMPGSSEKTILLLESGVRFHLTTYTRDLPDMPSPFTMKLRKHLRTKRLEDIRQLGNDRIIIFTFGSGESTSYVVLELFSNGNIVLADRSFMVKALLRSHQFSADIHLRVDSIYRTDVESNIFSMLAKAQSPMPKEMEEVFPSYDAFHSWVTTKFQEMCAESSHTEKDPASEGIAEKYTVISGGKKRKKKPLTLKMILLSKDSIFSIGGPDIIEHCLLSAGLSASNNVEQLLADETETHSPLKLLFSRLPEMFSLLSQLNLPGQPGFIIASTVAANNPGETEVDLEYSEFIPLLLKQYVDDGSNEKRQVLRFPSFEQAVDEYFARLEAQKLKRQAREAQADAEKRVSKVKFEQQKALAQLVAHQRSLQKGAELIELYFNDVEKVSLVLNSAISSGMSWLDIETMVSAEIANGNPIARLVNRLCLDKNKVMLRLEDTEHTDEASDLIHSSESISSMPAAACNSGDEDEGAVKKIRRRKRQVTLKKEQTGNLQSETGEQKYIVVEVDLSLSAFANARNMYSHMKVAQMKEARTREAAAGALRAVEDQAARTLRKMDLKTSLVQSRKAYWFEKFNWFVTTEGYMVLSGRDAQQNDLLFKKYLRPQDIYVHADLSGASSCIVRSKSTASVSTAEDSVPLSPLALQEAGAFAVCRSVAWTHKAVSSAWWVFAHQVSKTAPTGEYLTTGSFMVYGKKNFLPPAALEMGFGIMFRLDDESVGRHINDRRERDWGAGSVDATGRQMEKLLERYDICLPEKAASLATAVVQPGFVAKDKSDVRSGTTKKTAGKNAIPVKEKEPLAHDSKSNESFVEMKGQSNATKKTKPINKKKGRRYLEQDEEDRQIAMSIIGHKSLTSTTSDKTSPEKCLSNQIVEEVRDSKDIISSLDIHVQKLLLSAEEEGLLNLSELADEEVRGLASFTVDQSRAVIDIFLARLRDTQTDSAPGNEDTSNRWRPGSSKSAALAATMRKYSSDLLQVLQAPVIADAAEKFPSDDDLMLNADDEELMNLLMSEGMMDEAEGRLANEVDKLTGCPVEDDNLLFAIPVCAPYTSMQSFKYKIKLLPGQGKKGKVTRQALQLLTQSQQLKGPGKTAGPKKDVGSDKERAHILAIPEPEALAVMIGDVKLSMPGLQQQLKASKESGKAKSKNTDHNSKSSSSSSKKNSKKKKHG